MSMACLNLLEIKEELNITKESLSNEMISLDEYKKTDKALYFDYLRKKVSFINKNSFFEILALIERIYFINISLYLSDIHPQEEKEKDIEDFRNIINYWYDDLCKISKFVNSLKKSTYKKAKKRTLKINDSGLKSIQLFNERITRIKKDFDNILLNPPEYFKNVLNISEQFYCKLKEYEKDPELMLDIIYYYYFPANCEWEDEDRDFVLKNYK